MISYAQKSFNFYSFGDIPYSIPEDEIVFQNLINNINKEEHAFSIHVGDFKSGGSNCSVEWYNKMVSYFNQFNKPLIYTPGDNEWTDCSRPACGSYNPEERLDVLRKTYFKDSKSFGKQTISLTSQALNPNFSKFVENNRWEYNQVTFATIHVVGSNNNFLVDSKTFNKEFYERDTANIAWLEETFNQAIQNKSLGVVIAIHADIFGKIPNEVNGFTNFIETLRKLSIQFGKPVLLINGDSHQYIVDKPLVYNQKNNKKTILNFTRVQVFGELDLQAIKVTVNPSNPNLFEIQPYIIPVK